MAHTVLATPEFESDYRKLPADAASRVDERIEALADSPERMRHPLKHVPKSLRGLHKYRIGD